MTTTWNLQNILERKSVRIPSEISVANSAVISAAITKTSSLEKGYGLSERRKVRGGLASASIYMFQHHVLIPEAAFSKLRSMHEEEGVDP